jgi:hypothetical protein
MRGTLTKIFSTHTNLRTPSVEGKFSRLPSAGQSFCMIAPSLAEEGLFREVTTSVVDQTWKVESNGKTIICFKTQNSVYGLAVEDMFENMA